jgi:hypothetical protein
MPLCLGSVPHMPMSIRIRASGNQERDVLFVKCARCKGVGARSRMSTDRRAVLLCADDRFTKRAMPIVAEAVRDGCLGKSAFVQGCLTLMEDHAHASVPRAGTLDIGNMSPNQYWPSAWQVCPLQSCWTCNHDA